MREILFRGKAVDTGEWVYGSFIPYWEAIHAVTRDIGRQVVQIVPDTVGQYIELNDINGKRIFEGDIVFDPRRSVYEYYEIIYESGSYRRKARKGFYYDISALNANDYMVVGNKWDNPRLLDGETKEGPDR